MPIMDELEAGIDALDTSDEFEWLAGAEQEWSDEAEAVFDEVEEMELAAELLEVDSEQELDEFIGKLVKKAGKSFRTFARSGVGKALGGVLKNVARTALPIAGKVLGNMALPGVGGVIGGKLASAAGRMFGLELEGLSEQDQEFEIARRFVRLSGAATRHAARMPARGNPVDRAKDAVLAAAPEHAPGLARARSRRRRPRARGGAGWNAGIRHTEGGRCRCARCRGGAYAGEETRGSWVRRGDVIILRPAW